MIEMIREKISGCFVRCSIGSKELEVILWVSWKSWRFM